MLDDTLVAPAGPWTRVDVLPRVSSTNAVSLADPVPWRLVVAEEQEAGRGRHSRVWVSPAGTSVALSLTVPLPGDVARWGWVPLVTGLAVRDALERLARAAGADVEVALKWPNDVLVRPTGGPGGGEEEFRKVCGILCESAGDLVVVGVGINVTVPESQLPVPTATSLHLAGLSVRREDVVIAVAEAFATRYAALAGAEAPSVEVRRADREACSTLGLRVRIHLPGGPGDVRDLEGEAVDLDPSGCLVVDVDGRRRTFAAGDVVHVRPAERA